MRKFKMLSVLVFCLAVAFAFAGCQTPAGRSTGQVVDDATITTKVKAKLFDDPVVSGLAVSVDTFEGEVTLTGAVPSQDARERAARIAASVQGVRNVNNLIKVDTSLK